MRVDFRRPGPVLTSAKSWRTHRSRAPRSVSEPKIRETASIALVDSRIDPNTHAHFAARARLHQHTDGMLVPGMLMHVAIEKRSAHRGLRCRNPLSRRKAIRLTCYVIVRDNGQNGRAGRRQSRAGVDEGRLYRNPQRPRRRHECCRRWPQSCATKRAGERRVAQHGGHSGQHAPPKTGLRTRS